MPWICDDHGYETGPGDCPGCLRITIADQKKEIEGLQRVIRNADCNCGLTLTHVGKTCGRCQVLKATEAVKEGA